MIGPAMSNCFRQQRRDAHGPLAAQPDPLAVPIRRFQQSHVERSRVAPRADLPLVAPYADFPITRLPAGELLALVLDVHRCIGLDLAAIPQITHVLGELFRRAGHEQLVGLLRRASAVGLEHPGQPRLRDVDPERIRRILTRHLTHTRPSLQRSNRNQAHCQYEQDSLERTHLSST